MGSKYRLDAAVTAVVALAVAFALWQYARSLGFPDGFRSELQRAEQTLCNVFIGISLVAGVWFAVLARRQSNSAATARKVLGSMLLYGLLLAVLVGVDLYLRHSLRYAGIG